MDRNTLFKIIGAGTLAPSGENAQPWKFDIEGDTIHQFNVPERDQSLYNWGQRASYVANGAALENILIAASHLGYNARANIFPDTSKSELVANIKLEQGIPKEELLYTSIEKRVTNRKPYSKAPLIAEQRQELIAAGNSIGGAQFYCTEDAEQIKTLAGVGATNERIMLGNKDLHNFFFSHINWTQEEENGRRYGFYIKTLELPTPALAMFKLFRSWTRMRFFSKLGFPKVVAKQNAQVYSSAPAFCIITIPDITPASFVSAGRATERFWLTATSLGLSVQPLTGVLFFMLRIMAGEDSKFSEAQKQLIKEKYAVVKKLFNVQNGHIAMMFRVGAGDPPSAQSTRYEHPV